MPEPYPVAAASLPEPEPTPVADIPTAAIWETVRSPDGRLEAGADTLRVHAHTFRLLELERAELKPVRWLLWYLLGGLVFTIVALGYLQFWLRTMPAVLGLVVGALLLIVGRRGTNRLRLLRLGREALYFSLPGSAESWYPLIGEVNRRISTRHEEAAQAAARAWAQAQAEAEAAVMASQSPSFHPHSAPDSAHL